MSVTPVFEKAKAENRAVLVGCLPVGFPTYDRCLQSLRAMIEAGVDIIELEFPYSDPTMDGPVIQRASEIALGNGIRSSDVLRMTEEISSAGACTVLMTYWNPIERYGVDRFARDFAAAGGSALVTPDLIPDEASEWMAASDAAGLDRVFLVAPSSTDERLRLTTDACRGFVYATSVMGVTGTRTSTSKAAPELVARVRAIAPTLPVGVGLGVSNGEQAAEIASFADAVIVASVFVRRLLETDERSGVAVVGELAGELAAGVRKRSR